MKYTSLSDLHRIAHIKSMSYGKRIPVKTIWLGIAMDAIIPFTFGMITIAMRKIFGDIMFYISVDNGGIKQ